MKLDTLAEDVGEWLRGTGPESDIVMSSRVRLARNVAHYPFVSRMSDQDRGDVERFLRERITASPAGSQLEYIDVGRLEEVDRQFLVERQLISREHAEAQGARAVAIDGREQVSLMINEEDHLRMQAICCGLQLGNVFDMINRVDSELESSLDFAFDAHLGYLTACPSNVGTGMRASAMLHLPALVMSDQINKIINSVNKIGLAVRGLHGEGTEAMGNLFQVSNQTTLGETEEEIIGRLNRVIEQIIEHEQNARALLAQRKPVTLHDQIGRAYGILCHAFSMSSKEALNLLSVIKLGIDLDVFPEAHRFPVDELFIETQPAHLQKGAQVQKMSSEERDTLRATIIRAKLNQMPGPDMSRLKISIPPANSKQ